MKIRLTKDLNYFYAPVLNQVRPSGTVKTADNSVQARSGDSLVVEFDTEQQAQESDKNVTWFKNDRYAGGFPVSNDAFEKIED